MKYLSVPMNQKITYSLLLFIILAMSFIVSCKSEKSNTPPIDPKDKSTKILIDKKGGEPAPVDIIDSNDVKYLRVK